MSRRTRRSTSLVACFQDQYVPPLTQHRHQDAKLKTLLQCQDTELKALHQFEEEQQILCLYEDKELRIPRAPLQYEDDEEKTLEQYEDEQDKEPWKCQGREQKKQEQHQDGEEEKPEQYQDDEKTPQLFGYEDAKTSKYQDEKQVEYEYYAEEKTSEQNQDEEHKAPQQCQEADEQASEQHEEETEEQKEPQEFSDMEQKTSEQHQGAKNLPAPPCTADGVPRFSLQELIQEKQLPVREAKLTNKLGGYRENVTADHKFSGSGGATGGTTLAMVIRRPEGGKKSKGVIRRCVKALNQMIKAKHGSKKNPTL